MNGVDENSYLANWTGKTYKDGGKIIPPEDLPYKYFASKGINAARIRIWVGDNSDGNYENALANGLAAREAGLYTLLAIFFSEQWSENVGCDESTVGSIFRDLSFEDKKSAVKQYCSQLINKFKNDGLSFDLYAVGNEVYNCICGETDKYKMADILNAVVVYRSGESTEHILPVDYVSCFGQSGDPWPMSQMREEANKRGGSITSVSSVSVTYGSDGKTHTLVFTTNQGFFEVTGEEFKTVFNLRAPGRIALKSSLFNIEKK